MRKIVLLAIILIAMVSAVSAEAPQITSHTPQSPVESVVGTPKSFSITASQPVRVEWWFDGKLIGTDGFPHDITMSTFVQSGDLGTHRVTAWAINDNGADNQEWTWVVTEPVPIPEFPTIALPIVAVLGLVFFQYRKKKE